MQTHDTILAERAKESDFIFSLIWIDAIKHDHRMHNNLGIFWLEYTNDWLISQTSVSQ